MATRTNVNEEKKAAPVSRRAAAKARALAENYEPEEVEEIEEADEEYDEYSDDENMEKETEDAYDESFDNNENDGNYSDSNDGHYETDDNDCYEEDEEFQTRMARLERKTAETDIRIEFNLDGTGKSRINTGIGFFDHMLYSFTKHGLFDMELSCNGDLYVDTHHTIEDIGIVLGVAIREAVGNKKGIKRYGSVMLPMDDALVLCSLDLSGRPYLAFDANFTTEKVGYMDTCMVREFFYAISYSAGMNLHIKMLDGINDHHIIEGMFKAFAKALDAATQYDERITDVLSTKGLL